MKAKTYEKIGQAVVKGTIITSMAIAYVSIFLVGFMRG